MFIRIYRVKFLRYDFFSYFEFIVPMTSSFVDIILLNFKFIDIYRKILFLNAILTHFIFFRSLPVDQAEIWYRDTPQREWKDFASKFS